MKLSISNIAWNREDEESILKYLQEKKYAAIEIAPTKIVGANPYAQTYEAKMYANTIISKYDLCISSMQSIWYGRNERIFNSENECQLLLQYTKEAIDFAEAIECHNLVFGCPKNRIISEPKDIDKAVHFFKEIGDYAFKHNTILALEPNPTIYGTNFMNTTQEAITICRMINTPGVGINFDLGTVIENNEDIQACIENLDIISHIHISEPFLELIKVRDLHKRLFNLLKQAGYKKYISIEMKEQKLLNVLHTIDYIWEVSL